MKLVQKAVAVTLIVTRHVTKNGCWKPHPKLRENIGGEEALDVVLRVLGEGFAGHDARVVHQDRYVADDAAYLEGRGHVRSLIIR